MSSHNRRFPGVIPSRPEATEYRPFRTTIMLLGAVILLMILAAVVTFLLTIRGPEEVLVPDVVGPGRQQVDVVDAMVRLQEKGLYGKVQLKHSSTYGRGTVMDQRPRPGAVVKAGRRVLLTISEGPVINSIENYVGGKLAAIRIELKELFPGYDEPLIQIREPVMYVHDDSDPGTILQQSPAPGTAVREGEVTYLDLVVSKGPQGKLMVTRNYLGRPFEGVMGELAAEGVPFTFAIREPEGDQPAGTILKQEPAPGEEVPEGTIVVLTMIRPRRVERGMRFGVFTADLVRYPIYVQMDLVARSSEGERVIVSMRHPGGPINWPYIVHEDARITFYVNGTEWQR